MFTKSDLLRLLMLVFGITYIFMSIGEDNWTRLVRQESRFVDYSVK